MSLTKKCLRGLFFIVLPFIAYGANPLITNVRTADPNPLVYNNRFYIVCGQDEVDSTGFEMYAWRLLSSENMTDWTDHGQILRPDQISWMPDSEAWASSLVFRNGYFYLYTSNARQIGVFRSTSITGPYEDVNHAPLIDANTPGHAARDIDPMCYIDDDGQAYLFWGGDGNCRYARLNSNMTSLASSVMDVPGLTSYLEAPFVIKENNTYFLMYADSPWPSNIRYATSSSIEGPWTYRAIIGTPTGSGTNHEGAAYYKGEWWYIYHNESLSGNNPYSRSVCADKMYISGNTILPVAYTLNNGGGVNPVPTPQPEQQPVWTGGPYDLDGLDDYINIPLGTMDNLKDFTIAFKADLDSLETWSRFFDFGIDSSRNMFLTPTCDQETLRFAITTTGNGGEQRIDTSIILPTGASRHIAVVKEGHTGIIYVEGVVAGRNDALTLTPADLGTTNLNYIGRSIYSSDPYLNGRIESFRIYNRALSGQEIANLAAGIEELPGDVNGNGKVDIVDALMTAQFAVGLNPPGFNTGAADTNCDGTINIIDALRIAQYSVGLVSSPVSCGSPVPTPVPGENLYNSSWQNLSGNLDAHDPVIIKQDGTWYVYATAPGITVKSSTDGLYWQNRGKVFNTNPSWHSEMVPGTDGNIWAPDIFFFRGTYYLYYSVSTFGSSHSVIGLAANSTLNPSDPAYHWEDKGAVIRSYSDSGYNCIDPNLVLDENGDPWMSFGSFWSGIKLVKLDPSTMKPPASYTLTSIAHNSSIEAPFIVRRQGYYYLFVSHGMCCQGVESTYNIRVGRSLSITGPYTDMNGNSLMNSGGTLIDGGDNRWIGPGHNAVYLSGDTGILVNHAYDAWAAGRATLRIKPLYFDSQGWPHL